MLEILEYITQNYAWFLGGAVLILLAIIGYYADKTNFGQGKDNNDSNKPELLDINNMRLMDVATNVDNDIKQLDINSNDIQTNAEVLDLNNSLENEKNSIQSDLINENISLNNDVNVPNTLVVENAKISNNLSNIVTPQLTVEQLSQLKELDLSSDINSVKVSLVNDETKRSSYNEEAFNKFNDEFNALLPKKELINSDLLEDINDIELGKTQKFDFSDVPDLDNIELPKIKNIDSVETDIWKF